ncbi:hypothetical protein FG386_002617 [Cryptosporidium ryanae]|uniref:uncharacterized protein n=1 Tax=Cryptosporidium ryanae TaxID=515981 RepID=UPI00351A058C|nr:hypothetical protein FG386_002617 [Cryptosporidium ryanae]
MKQIIDYEFNFKEKIDEVLEYIGDIKINNNYNVVSILGSQSTGKSTLLNFLFGTNFKVMDKMSVGYCQTTKGLWLGIGKSEFQLPLLVWDVEGTDSMERGEDRITFENRAALFSLAISDCMIINIPLLNLTTYSSSNFSLLKTILNSWFSLKLNENEQRKSRTLIFAIRDITINDSNDMLLRKINQILDLLWSEVIKMQKSQLNNSDGLHNSSIVNSISLHDIFEIKVYGLPSYPNEKDGFMEVVGRIKAEMTCSILPKKYNRCIPIEGYEMYCKTIWNCIVNCEELNIPSQIKMISKFRCERTKDEVIERMKSKIIDLKRWMEKKELEYYDFRSITYDILNESINDYFEITGKYDSEVTLNILISMIIFFFIEFKEAVNMRMSAERQILRECKNIFKYYENDKNGINDDGAEFNSTIIKDDVFDSFVWSEKELKKFDILSLKWVTECPNHISKYNLLDQIRTRCIPDILNRIEKSPIHDRISENNEILVNYNTSDQRKLFSETLEIQSKKIQEKLMQEFFEFLIKDIVREISKIFNDYGFTNPKLTINGFWQKTGESILKVNDSLFLKYEAKWLNLLKCSSTLDEYSCTDLKEEITIQLFVRLISFIQQQSKYFHIQIIDRFKREFEIDENDIPRQWIGEEPNKMKELFVNSKNNALSIMGVFKLNKYIFEIFGTKFDDFFSKIAEDPEIEGICPFLKNHSTNIESTSTKCFFDESEFILIIPEGTIQEIEAKSIKEITDIYSKAQLLQSTGKQPQNIPWWMYVLLLFLGFDELVYILTSPLMLTLLLVIGAFLYSYLTGNLPLFYNCSHKVVITSSKLLHHLTGIMHNSLNSGDNQFNSK